MIANDQPILVVYKGEVLLPILHDYPEEKFGGFLARTDYRDAVIADEIKAHGFMVWPPIRFPTAPSTGSCRRRRPRRRHGC